MPFPFQENPDEPQWWEMISEYPELGEGLEELSADPEAGIVAAVGIFTMLKLRFWHRQPEAVSENPIPVLEHQSDESPPPGASQSA